MTAISDVRQGSRVEITGPDGAQRIGHVDFMETPSNLAPPGRVRAILERCRVARVAMISYAVDASVSYAFVALEVDGKWLDLNSRPVEMRIIGQHGWDCPERN